MSLPICTPSDFSGFYNITQDAISEDNLKIYIDKYEKKYLRELLSDEAYQQIKAESTLSDKFEDLINGCDYVKDGKNLVNIGLKEVLKAFIYYHFVGDNFTNMIGGNYQSLGTNANPTDTTKNLSIVNARYNEGVSNWVLDVLNFINTFEVQVTEITEALNNVGTYTIIVTSNKYMVDGDEVIIGEKTYTVSNVDDNMFDIVESESIDFIGQDAEYNPFNDYNLPFLETVFL